MSSVILLLAVLALGGVHPVAFFFNQTIHKVSPGDIASGKASLPLTRWVEVEGQVVPGSIFEHCHRIYSYNQGDFHTYLIYAVRGDNGTVIVRNHIDMQVSDSACRPRSLPLLPVKHTVPIKGQEFRYFNKPGKDGKDSEAHTLGVPKTVRVRGMMRYTLWARLPGSGKAYLGTTWKTPFIEAHETPSLLSNGLFYGFVICFIALMWLGSKYGVEDVVHLTCALDEPGRTWAPGDTVPFTITIRNDKAGLFIKNFSARLSATRETITRTVTIHEQDVTFLQNRLTQAGETVELKGAFVLPFDLKNFKKPKDARSHYTDWKITIVCDIKDKLSIEKELNVNV